ncbi:hypothetical protein KDI_25980 [Dictyobacter arantiisoli]|uniref:Uncharacterized protein n=1 Tax=Dictyobacter arantiisoli TaxID=2014874 RepID=A0A5A5TDS5_9CHLR|nr:hypothetical protein KDI_25980 [Dictyobacter arantiisoli]
MASVVDTRPWAGYIAMALAVPALAERDTDRHSQVRHQKMIPDILPGTIDMALAQALAWVDSTAAAYPSVLHEAADMKLAR